MNPVRATRRSIGRWALRILPALLAGAAMPAGRALAQGSGATGNGAMPLPTLLAQADTLPPSELYRLAGLLFSAGRRDEAVRWFYVAQLRARYRLAATPGLRPDGEPALYAAFNETLGRPINEWAFGDIDAAATRMQEALDWDAAHANGFMPKTTNPAALQSIRGGLQGLKSSLLAQKDDIRRQRTANGLENR